MKTKIDRWCVVVLLLLSLAELGHAIPPRYPGGKLTQSSATPKRGGEEPPAASQNNASPPNAWRGLVPLSSTRADVERVLGKAKTAREFISVYKTIGETVDVLYSAGPCMMSAVERWNVPANVVIRIVVRPRTEISVQALNLDRARYPRLQEGHLDNWVRYMNDEDGVMVETIMYSKNEQVYAITYWPRIKDKSLRCS